MYGSFANFTFQFKTNYTTPLLRNFTIEYTNQTPCDCPPRNITWNYNCSIGCNLDYSCNMKTRNINITGAGNFTINSFINNIDNIYSEKQCKLKICKGISCYLQGLINGN